MSEINKYDSICIRCDVNDNKEIHLKRTLISEKECYLCSSYESKVEDCCSECGRSMVRTIRCSCPEEY